MGHIVLCLWQEDHNLASTRVPMSRSKHLGGHGGLLRKRFRVKEEN